jgi:hypothetical protein
MLYGAIQAVWLLRPALQSASSSQCGRAARRPGRREQELSVLTREHQTLGRPRGLEFGCQRVFVLEASQTLGQRSFRRRNWYQEQHRIAVLPGAVKREFRSIAPTRIQNVPH